MHSFMNWRTYFNFKNGSFNRCNKIRTNEVRNNLTACHAFHEKFERKEKEIGQEMIHLSEQMKFKGIQMKRKFKIRKVSISMPSSSS